MNDPFAVNRLDFYLKVLLEEENGLDLGKRRVKVIFTKTDLEIGFSWETMAENLERWGLSFGKVSAFRGVGVKEELEEIFDELSQEREEEGRSVEEKEEGRRKEEGGKKEKIGRKDEGGKMERWRKGDERKKKNFKKRGGGRRDEETEEEETVLSRRFSKELERRPICHCF